MNKHNNSFILCSRYSDHYGAHPRACSNNGRKYRLLVVLELLWLFILALSIVLFCLPLLKPIVFVCAYFICFICLIKKTFVKSFCPSF